MIIKLSNPQLQIHARWWWLAVTAIDRVHPPLLERKVVEGIVWPPDICTLGIIV
jgi:hypothetical protein